MVNRLIEPTVGPDPHRRRGRRHPRRHRAPPGIGYVIQQVGLFPHQTIGDNVATVPRLLGWSKERHARRAPDELLTLVGLDPATLPRPLPRQLSGGERQRVGVARALAADPPIMLMDEPFGAVDPIVRERLQNEFLRLQEELAKTILFVTHDIDEAIKMGDLVAVMQAGGVRRPVRAAGGDPRQPRVGVRRPVRRRGPRAQAPVADPRRRRSSWSAGHGRVGRATPRRAAARRTPTPFAYLLARRRGAPAARLGPPRTRLPRPGP